MDEQSEGINDLWEEIREEVHNGVGWFVIAVASPKADEKDVESTLPFVYTVGLAAAEHPELIVSGPLPPADCHAIIKTVIENLDSKELSYEIVPTAGLRLSGVLANDYDVMLKRITGPRQHHFLSWAVSFQIDEGRDPSQLQSLQIVLPDPENRLPGDDGFRLKPRQEKLWE